MTWNSKLLNSQNRQVGSVINKVPRLFGWQSPEKSHSPAVTIFPTQTMHCQGEVLQIYNAFEFLRFAQYKCFDDPTSPTPNSPNALPMALPTALALSQDDVIPDGTMQRPPGGGPPPFEEHRLLKVLELALVPQKTMRKVPRSQRRQKKLHTYPPRN